MDEKSKVEFVRFLEAILSGTVVLERKGVVIGSGDEAWRVEITNLEKLY